MKQKTTALSISIFPLLFTAAVHAQTGPRLLLEPLPEPENYRLNIDVAQFGDTDIDRSPNDVGMTIYEASGRARFRLGAITEGIQKAQPRVGFDLFVLDLSNDDALLPGQFNDASVGVSLGILNDDKWVAGIALGVGFASVNGFHDGNGLYGKADLAVGYTIDEKQTVGLVLNYDGNRSILPDVPLPGFQYTNRYSDELTFSIGFPFSSVRYKPDGKWTFDVTFAIPDNFNGTVDYAINETFGVFAGLSSKNKSFHWDELQDNTDRIFFSQNRAELGVRGTIDERFSFVAAGGVAFGQEFEVGFDTRESRKIAELDSSFFGRLGLEFRF